jgi:murein DD-endopeptidase MepM/ murein hydrolase activator NlpD
MAKYNRLRNLPVFILLSFIVSTFALFSCNTDPETEQRTRLLTELEDAFTKDPAALCDGFDFPVGPPEGKGYYIALGFGERSHLGEDWNGKGGGNTDLGDPVYATANGFVVFAEDHGGGWGNVVRIVHRFPSDGEEQAPRYVETLYAHFREMKVSKGDFVKRGEVIGTMGNAGGLYYAHLHFEMRTDIFLPIGGGYGKGAGFVSPSEFIKKHRPKR